MKWFTDNQNVVHIVQVGSGKPHLQEVAMCVFQVCLQYSIRLNMEWIPRSSNEVAHYLSHIVDLDDWQVSADVFSKFDVLWGPHTVNRFASAYNTHLMQFNGKFWSPGTEAVDDFTVDWAAEVNWWVPHYVLLLAQSDMCKHIQQKEHLPFQLGSLPLSGLFFVLMGDIWLTSFVGGALCLFHLVY